MKEELLNGLRELQSQLGESVTEEQVKLLDEHYNIKRNLEKEISDLLTRISNDKNYTRTRELPTSTDVLEREIANSDIRLSEAQEAITSYQLRLAEIESELTKTQNMISSSESTISDLQEAINNGEIAEEDIPSFNTQIDINHLANSQLEVNLTNLNEEKAKVEQALANTNETIARENAVRQGYEQQLEATSNIELGDYIDEVERTKDRRKVLELQRTLNSLNTKTELLTYDLSTELSNIISDVESNTLTNEQIKQRITTFYSHIPTEFFQNDYTTREEAQEQLELSINDNDGEIARYQDRLSNDENYRYSIFEIERDEVEAERLNNKIASSNVEIARLERELKRNAIQFSINHNYAIKRQRAYRALGENVDSSIEINYNRFLEKHSSKQESLQNESKLLKQQLHEAKMNKKHFERDLENAKANSGKQVINKKAKQADEEKLQNLLIVRENLNKRRELLAYDPQQALLEMLALVDREVEATPVTEEVTPYVAPELAPHVEETEPVETTLEPTPEIEENEQEKDDFPIPVPLGNLEEKLGEDEEDLEESSFNPIEQTNSLEDMLRYVKEKDQREVEKALKKKESEEKVTKDKTIVKNDSEKEIESRVEIVEEKKSNRIVNILNCIIVFLVVIFIVLCGMIGYQLFF